MKNLKTAVMAACLVVGMFAEAQNVPPVDSIKQKAEAGDAMAQAQYASMLQFGQGVEKNETEALKWYQKAAEAGNAYAQANVGAFYQTGRCGVTKDFVKAAEWYRKAAEQGNAHAQFYLAGLYMNGNGVEKNMKKSTELLGLAAKGGMSQAQVAYAMRLYKGDGIDMDIDEALKWAEKAATSGDSNAVKLAGALKDAKEMWAKTPKSLLGIEFGKTVEEVASVKKPSKTDDGSSVEAYVDPRKPFRKFTGKNGLSRINIFGTISSHKVFRFKWTSDDFSKETTEEEAVSEFKKTCDVIAKKFGSEFHDVPIRSKGTIWDRKVAAEFGFLKVEMFMDAWKMTITATHTMFEAQAKGEVGELKAAAGDGSDAL